MGCGASNLNRSKSYVQSTPGRGPASPSPAAPKSSPTQAWPQSPAQPSKARHTSLSAAVGRQLRVVLAAGTAWDSLARRLAEELARQVASCAPVQALFADSRVSVSFLRQGMTLPSCEVMVLLVTPDWLLSANGSAALRGVLRLKGLSLGPELLAFVHEGSFGSADALEQALCSPAGLLLSDVALPGCWGRLSRQGEVLNPSSELGPAVAWLASRIDGLVSETARSRGLALEPCESGLRGAPRLAASPIKSQEPCLRPADAWRAARSARTIRGGEAPSSPMRPSGMPSLRGAPSNADDNCSDAASISEAGLPPTRNGWAERQCPSSRPCSSSLSFRDSAAVSAAVAAARLASQRLTVEATTEPCGLSSLPESSFPPSPSIGSMSGTAKWIESMRSKLGTPAPAMGSLPVSKASEASALEASEPSPPVPTSAVLLRGPGPAVGARRPFMKAPEDELSGGSAPPTPKGRSGAEHRMPERLGTAPGRTGSAAFQSRRHHSFHLGVEAIPNFNGELTQMSQDSMASLESVASVASATALSGSLGLSGMWWGAHPAETRSDRREGLGQGAELDLLDMSSDRAGMDLEVDGPTWTGSARAFAGHTRSQPVEILDGVFSSYEFGARLVPAQGGGGWGPKFIATDLSLDRRVVLWRFSPLRVLNDVKEQYRLRDTLGGEVERLRRVRHPRLCPYLGVELVLGDLYVVSGYGAGGSVADWLADTGPLGEAPVRRIIRAVLEGLNHLHWQDLVHGAVRGGNVLLGPGSAVRLCDFGLVALRRLASAGASVGGSRSGSSSASAWLAPELLDGCSPSAEADIWGLGCLVVEAVTGSPPAPGTAHRAMQASEKLPLLPGEIGQIPTSCHSLVKQCLQISPARRPSAQRLLEGFDG